MSNLDEGIYSTRIAAYAVLAYQTIAPVHSSEKEQYFPRVHLDVVLATNSKKSLESPSSTSAGVFAMESNSSSHCNIMHRMGSQIVHKAL